MQQHLMARNILKVPISEILPIRAYSWILTLEYDNQYGTGNQNSIRNFTVEAIKQPH